MQVNGVTNAAQIAANNPPKPASAGSSQIDSSQFMTLLLTQMTHQNPLEPMDNAEMMSQFSQLNSLQELHDIHAAMDKVSVSNQTAYLASLIGKTVKVNRPDGTPIEGVVKQVFTAKDKPQLLVGNETVDLSDVLEIKGTIE